MIIKMRTTVNLPDEISDLVRSLADAKGISLGDAIAELVRRGLNAGLPGREEAGFPCFAVGAEAGPITLEQTLVVEHEQ